jgi:asparaginyl-tRNA synthetase
VLRRANEKFEFPVKWGIDLESEHRALPGRKARDEAGHRDELPEGHEGVLHAPQRRRPDGCPLPNPSPASGGGRGGGALAPGSGEIIGGSQREERLDVLDRSMAERGIDQEHCAPTLPSPESGPEHPRLRRRPRQRA